MIRWLLIALFFYLLLRVIRGPKKNRRSGVHFQFGRFNQKRSENNSRPGFEKLEEIEEAEFEDITDKEKKNKNR